MFGSIVTLLLVVLVGAVQPEVVFSHEFARDSMLPLAAAAYVNDSRPCLEEHFGKNVELPYRRIYEADCSGPNPRFTLRSTCYAYMAVLHDKKAIVLSFRGTDTKLQLFKEIKYSGLLYEWFNGAYVNHYFGLAFNNLWNTLMDHKYSLGEDIQDLIQEYVNIRGYELWITGHSLGGALASLAASYLREKSIIKNNKLKLVTFGQPRTGDHKFAEDFNRQVDYAFRVIHAKDGVPHIPFDSETFSTFGYKHHKKEVFYGGAFMRDDEFLECEDDERFKYLCSSQYPLTELSFEEDHLHYYGEYPSKWAEKGCPKTPNT